MEKLFPGSQRRAPWLAGLAVCAWAAGCAMPASAQQSREHAQMLMMQQQMQHLQQENSSLKTQKSDLEQSSAELQKKSDAAHRDAARLKAKGAELQKQNDQMTADLAAARDAIASANGQIDHLRGELAQRDEALHTLGQQAADNQKRFELERTSLKGSLSGQTVRAEKCEAKHAALLTFAEDVLGRYEAIDLRHSGDPVFGFGKVAEEKRLQQLHDRLFELHLEPPAEPTHAGP